MLLHLDDPDGRTPWLEWSVWLAANGQPGLEAGRLAAVQALRPADPGGGRRAGRRAGPRPADRRASARRAPRGAVPEALRFGPGLLRGRRAARGRARRRGGVRRLAARRGRRRSRGRPPMRASRRARARFRAEDVDERRPSPPLRIARCRRRRGSSRFAHLVPRGARVLDLACGTGRHARFFAARGCRVVAVDRDAAALAAMAGVAGIETRVVDLETGAWPLAGERFDAVVVANYLHRPLLAPLLGDARRRRRAALRDVRPRQRGVRAADESGFPARAGRAVAACRRPARRWSRSSRAASPATAAAAVVQRLAAVGHARGRGRPRSTRADASIAGRARDGGPAGVRMR